MDQQTTFGRMDALCHPAMPAASHGLSAWGRDANDTARTAAHVAFIARPAGETLRLNPKNRPAQKV